MGLAEVAKITITDTRALSLFEKVNETAKGLDKMLIKLQSISDVGSTQLIFKEVYFSEIFNSVSDVFREEIKAKDIRIIIRDEISDSFLSYPGLIKIITENLVENSINFSHPNTTIKLSASPVEGGVNLVIEDDGYGIDAEYTDRIFDMYFRAHERSKGNGLGLYIVKRVVEKLRGQIELSSTMGVGTIVRIFLPNHSTQLGNA